MKKKIFAVFSAAAVCLSAQTGVFAEDGSVSVYVTLTNGENLLCMQKVRVADVDGDGDLTVNDALFSAHDRYMGGSGYSSDGEEIAELCGVSGGVYGCYLNNSAVDSVSDYVWDGDRLDAFVFTDTAGLSDVYSFFDESVVEAKAGERFELFLTGVFGEDASEESIAGAKILVNGKSVNAETDVFGKAVISIRETGTAVISAEADGLRLVAPFCTAVISPAEAGDESCSATVSVTRGESLLSAEEVTVTDIDGDGDLTVKDALACAHARYFDGGEEGFSFRSVGDAVYISGLWGETGGEYGCYVNDAPAESLLEPIYDRSRVSAFAYGEGRSEVYAYFDSSEVDTAEGGTVYLRLTGSFYGEDGELIEAAVPDAEILIDGKGTGVFTDENGGAEFTFTSREGCLISARSDSRELIPPFCRAFVQEDGGSDDELDEDELDDIDLEELYSEDDEDEDDYDIIFDEDDIPELPEDAPARREGSLPLIVGIVAGVVIAAAAAVLLLKKRN